MGRHDKLLARILRGGADANVAFDDLRALLRHLGFEERTRGSHHVFRRAGVEELINLQREGLSGAAGTSGVDQVRSRRDGRGELMDAFKYELIVYWSAEDAAFVVDVPELPGCMAHGATPGAAVASAQEAIALWVEAAREDGRPVPEPKGRRLLYA
jgi:predicted RNase H-like HicB family nuclease